MAKQNKLWFEENKGCVAHARALAQVRSHKSKPIRLFLFIVTLHNFKITSDYVKYIEQQRLQEIDVCTNNENVSNNT